jgi:hypothetical protein
MRLIPEQDEKDVGRKEKIARQSSKYDNQRVDLFYYILQ